ncbi:MAG: MarC family protein [Caulobacterales bacterium]|nr:MarC family protein [Caulobacterales bacterium]
MPELFITAFVTFFVVIDPPGCLAVFAGLTRDTPGGHRRLMAFKSVMVASVVLVLFAYAGDWLLAQLHVSLDAFRIAGGLLLFLMAMEMLFEKRAARREERLEGLMDEEGRPPEDISVFPMGIPMLAGPGAIASMLLFMNESAGLFDQLAVLAAAGANLVVCVILFLLSGPLMRLMGETITAMITRILGVILAALSAQFVIDGARGAFAPG